MRRSFIPAVALSLLAVPVAAQNIGPGIATITGSRPQAGPPQQANLDPTAFGLGQGTEIQQFEARPTGTPGVYRLAMTVFATSTIANPVPIPGGAFGQANAVEGTYDLNTGQATMNNLAASFNATIGNGFSFSISPDGLTATWDSPSGPAWASRATVGSAWGTPASITGLAAGATFVDGKLYVQGGQLKYALVNPNGNGRIIAGDFNAGNVTNLGRISDADSTAPFGMHSATPIENGNGEAVAWLLGGAVANGHSDSYFMPAEDDGSASVSTAPINPPMTIWGDNGDWTANGTQLGNSGTQLWAWNATTTGAAYEAPLQVDSAMCNGGELVPGSTKVVNSWGPVGVGAWVHALIVGTPSGAAFPLANSVGNGIGGPGARPLGQIGVLPAIILSAPAAASNDANNVAFPIPVPANFPAGTDLSVQNAVFDLSNNRWVVGNTAVIGS